MYVLSIDNLARSYRDHRKRRSKERLRWRSTCPSFGGYIPRMTMKRASDPKNLVTHAIAKVWIFHQACVFIVYKRGSFPFSFFSSFYIFNSAELLNSFSASLLNCSSTPLFNTILLSLTHFSSLIDRMSLFDSYCLTFFDSVVSFLLHRTLQLPFGFTFQLLFSFSTPLFNIPLFAL